MVPSNLVVDIGVDPLDERRRRRRALLRIGIPLGGVALMKTMPICSKACARPDGKADDLRPQATNQANINKISSSTQRFSSWRGCILFHIGRDHRDRSQARRRIR